MEAHFETWRDQIYNYLLKNTEPGEYVDMYPLGVLCPRPNGLSKEHKMKQILKDDQKERFKFLHPHKVRRKFVVDQALQSNTDALQKLWRNLVWEHMQMVCKPGDSISLASIGIAVRRPHENISHIKLRPLLEEDPEGRFNVTGYGLNIQVRLNHTEQSTDAYPAKKGGSGGSAAAIAGLQGWRDRIAEYLATAPFDPYMSQLGAKMPRPSDVDPSVKMQEVLQSDPQNRFLVSSIDGRFGSEKVSLRKQSATHAHTAYSHDHSEYGNGAKKAGGGGGGGGVVHSQNQSGYEKREDREIRSALTAVNDALAGMRTTTPNGATATATATGPNAFKTAGVVRSSSLIGSMSTGAIVPGVKYSQVAATKATPIAAPAPTAVASSAHTAPAGAGAGGGSHSRSQSHGQSQYQNHNLNQPQVMPTCIICMERERSIVLLPCRHLLTCEGCGETVVECPVCREAVSHRLIVFAS